MSQIDWSKAPEDATHHGRGEDCCYWAKCIGDRQYFINIARWDSGRWKEVTERYDVDFLTSRPKSEWTGEGLPPVGVRIEAKHKNAQADWARPGFYETEVVAIGKQLVIFEADGSGHEKVGRLADYIFRPIRTPEQIAAEKRSRAIDEMCKECGYDGGGASFYTCAGLYDAGYRKFENVENEE